MSYNLYFWLKEICFVIVSLAISGYKTVLLHTEAVPVSYSSLLILFRSKTIIRYCLVTGAGHCATTTNQQIFMKQERKKRVGAEDLKKISYVRIFKFAYMGKFRWPHTWVQNHKIVLKGGPEANWPQGITDYGAMCQQINHVRFLQILDKKVD